ncbi:MAG: Rieske 2Fe-2S domain-containing protein [Candidatus Eisenbacteria bacterium]
MTKKFVAVTTAEQIPEGESRVFDLDLARVALCKVGGQIFAIDDMCSHDDGPLGEGCLVAHEISGAPVTARASTCAPVRSRMPAVAPVAVYAVKVEAGQVLIELDEDDLP